MEQPSAETASTDLRFAAAVAAFGQILKGGRNTGTYSYDDVIALAQSAKGEDRFGYRAEFINLVRLAKSATAMQ
jgi:Ca-activated chloride channel family protein